MRKRSWDQRTLVEAARTSLSVRQVIKKLGLVEAGGNYDQVKKYLKEYSVDTSHFKGMAWNKGLKVTTNIVTPLEEILVEESNFHSFKLKKRLFAAGIKEKRCEQCGWAKYTEDGFLPLELDHINGNRHDNRLVNLRVLCPNCHSLTPTHRGRNRGRRGGEIGIRATLKMS